MLASRCSRIRAPRFLNATTSTLLSCLQPLIIYKSIYGHYANINAPFMNMNQLHTFTGLSSAAARLSTRLDASGEG